MKLEVQLFARARELAGAGTVEIEVPGAAPRVGDLKNALGERFPDLRPLLPSLLIAVGTDYADENTPLESNAEIACFPPVSGG